MKNLSRIFLRIGAIFAIIFAVSLLLTTITFALLASPALKDALIEGFKDGTAHSSFEGTPEQQTAAAQLMFLIMSISFGLVTVIEGLTAFFSFRAINKPTEGKLVTAIVFGFFSSTMFPLVGGIFGLVALSKEQKQPAAIE